MSPESLFMDSGGRALLNAYGLSGNSWSNFFAAALPAWPKEGETADAPARLTRIVPMGTTGVVIADGRSLTIYGAVAAPKELPENVRMLRNIPSGKITGLAVDAMDLARPLLFLTVGVSYSRALSRAVLSHDPGSVVISGHFESSLDRDRVSTLEGAMHDLGIEGRELRKLALIYEGSLTDPTKPITNQGSERLMRKLLGMPTRRPNTIPDVGDLHKIRDAWARIDALPPTDDPSWSVALA